MRLLATGTCSISASQAGDSRYLPSPHQSFPVTKAPLMRPARPLIQATSPLTVDCGSPSWLEHAERLSTNTRLMTAPGEQLADAPGVTCDFWPRQSRDFGSSCAASTPPDPALHLALPEPRFSF